MTHDPVIWLVDANMRITWVSHGRYMDVVTGKLLKECLAPESVGDVASALGRVMLTGQPETVCYRIYDKTAWCTSVFRSNVANISMAFRSQEIPCLPDELSKREKEIMLLLKKGLRPGEIQRDLGISPSTYAEHQKNAMTKTRTDSPAELAVCAALMSLGQYVSRS